MNSIKTSLVNKFLEVSTLRIKLLLENYFLTGNLRTHSPEG